ncbi:MAG: DUF4982 domain-containing protein, partial [Phycisphaerae bacterium]|nr:DUF4982 domain-containing protein [Phycisphaerae bacterium]
VSVSCYTNSPEVRLTLNDREMGTQRLTEAVNGALTWQVPYEPGTLKAVGLQDGKAVCEFALSTAGQASRIELRPDTTQVQASGRDICHVEYRVVDNKGVLVPDAAHELTFEVDGPGEVLGIGNGDLNSPDSYKDLVHKAFRGRGLAILQSTRTPGTITLKATAQGLEPGSIQIRSVGNGG